MDKTDLTWKIKRCIEVGVSWVTHQKYRIRFLIQSRSATKNPTFRSEMGEGLKSDFLGTNRDRIKNQMRYSLQLS